MMRHPAKFCKSNRVAEEIALDQEKGSREGGPRDIQVAAEALDSYLLCGCDSGWRLFRRPFASFRTIAAIPSETHRKPINTKAAIIP